MKATTVSFDVLEVGELAGLTSEVGEGDIRDKPANAGLGSAEYPRPLPDGVRRGLGGCRSSSLAGPVPEGVPLRLLGCGGKSHGESESEGNQSHGSVP